MVVTWAGRSVSCIRNRFFNKCTSTWSRASFSSHGVAGMCFSRQMWPWACVDSNDVVDRLTQKSIENRKTASRAWRPYPETQESKPVLVVTTWLSPLSTLKAVRLGSFIDLSWFMDFSCLTKLIIFVLEFSQNISIYQVSRYVSQFQFSCPITVLRLMSFY